MKNQLFVFPLFFKFNPLTIRNTFCYLIQTCSFPPPNDHRTVIYLDHVSFHIDLKFFPYKLNSLARKRVAGNEMESLVCWAHTPPPAS